MSSSKYARVAYYINNEEYRVYERCKDNKDGITHIMIRDVDNSFDNLDYAQGDNYTIVIDKIDSKSITYSNITEEDIKRLKKFVLTMINQGKFSENVKVFIDNIGGYRIWNVNNLKDI